jgi:hypothetical protein
MRRARRPRSSLFLAIDFTGGIRVTFDISINSVDGIEHIDSDAIGGRGVRFS